MFNESQTEGWTPMIYTQGVFVKITSENNGTRWCSWLRHYATSRKVSGSNPDGVIRNFHDIILPAALRYKPEGLGFESRWSY